MTTQRETAESIPNHMEKILGEMWRFPRKWDRLCKACQTRSTHPGAIALEMARAIHTEAEDVQKNWVKNRDVWSVFDYDRTIDRFLDKFFNDLSNDDFITTEEGFSGSTLLVYKDKPDASAATEVPASGGSGDQTRGDCGGGCAGAEAEPADEGGLPEIDGERVARYLADRCRKIKQDRRERQSLGVSTQTVTSGLHEVYRAARDLGLDHRFHELIDHEAHDQPESGSEGGGEDEPRSVAHRELATILGALRFFQCFRGRAIQIDGSRDQLFGIQEVLTDNGGFNPMSNEEIDELTYNLNKENLRL